VLLAAMLGMGICFSGKTRCVGGSELTSAAAAGGGGAAAGGRPLQP